MQNRIVITNQPSTFLGSRAFGMCVQLHYLLARGDSVVATLTLRYCATHTQRLLSLLCRVECVSQRKRLTHSLSLHRVRLNRVLVPFGLHEVGGDKQWINFM